MARLVGSMGASRDPSWGWGSTRDGLESGTDTDPCGTAAGGGNSEHRLALELVWGVCCGSTRGGQEPCKQSELIDGQQGIPSHPSPPPGWFP